jgi:hypothetical protein
MSRRCPICSTPDLSEFPTNKNGIGYYCHRCGRYVLARSAESALPAWHDQHPSLASVLSHNIRLQQRDGSTTPLITTHNIEPLLDERLAPPGEQQDALILWAGAHQRSPQEWAKEKPPALGALIGAHKVREHDAEGGLIWLLNRGDLTLFEHSTEGEYVRIMLTMKGWERYSALYRAMIESSTAFMAMKFGEAELDALVQQCFKPAVQETGFELRLVTDKQGAGLIDDHIRTAIRTAAFCIADLTHANNGAYFEAGFAEGLGRPVIYTGREDVFREKKTHFDTNHMKTIMWMPDKHAEAAAALKDTIRATLPTKAKMVD